MEHIASWEPSRIPRVSNGSPRATGTATISGAAGQLREHGLRVTPQRRAILAVFSGDAGHLSADQIFEQATGEVPELARATVYNTLTEFLRAGIVRRVVGLGAVLYELDADAGHHHFRCSACGELFDVNPEGAAALDLPGGFEVERTQIMFEGLCERCSSEGN